MRKLLSVLLLFCGLAALAQAAPAEQPRTGNEPKNPGTANPLALLDGKVVFDVQERLRWEVRDNNFDFNDSINARTDDNFLLQRFRLGLLVKPTSWLRGYVQGQDTREIDSDRDNVPFVAGAEGDDTFDLRQAYVEVGDPASDCPIVAKIGRQELSYGDERLIGAFDWNNFSRTFDAVKLRYANTERRFWLDAFAAQVVTIKDFGPQGNYGWDFNDSDGNDFFSGIYGGTTHLPFQTTEAYFLYRDKADSDPFYTDDAGNTARAYDIKQEVYTLGLRAKSTPGKLHGFDYEAEAAYQWGRVAGRVGAAYPNAGPGGTALDHSAWAAMVRGGYTWTDCAWKPRFGLEYSVASGDENPNDGDNDAFMNLFPTNHKFYGYMDLFSWKNLHNPSVQLKFTPYQDPQAAWRNLWVQLDYHAFWLFTNEDAWYRANAVAGVRPVNAAAQNADRYVGSEIDLTVGYAPMKWVKLQTGYSHFFSGGYVEDTAAGTAGDDDADFGYVQAVVSF